jgi:hypothetical protein
MKVPRTHENNKERIKMKTSKENQMKSISKVIESVVFAAILACLIAAGSGSAFAQEVLRNDTSQDFKNTCPGGISCSDWNETVSTDEPSDPEPVVVIWSARYFATPDVYYAGLNVNGKGCQTDLYGPSNLDVISTNPTGHFLTITIQWIVLPTDTIDGKTVLAPGTSNTFELCGGGDGLDKGDSITIAQNTLSVAKY